MAKILCKGMVASGEWVVIKEYNAVAQRPSTLVAKYRSMAIDVFTNKQDDACLYLGDTVFAVKGFLALSFTIV